MQFFHDQADSVFDIRDIQCPSAQRCIAAGVIQDKNGQYRGATVITADGGQHWSQSRFAELPVSLFLLNESSGWMVTDRGIWTTNESGHAWRKLDGLKGIVQVYFLDQSHGFAVGYPKAFYETTDGGRKWFKVPAGDRPAGNPEDTIYDCIAFSGQQGAVLGRVSAQKDERAPLWMNPNTARYRRERESPTILLETFDGGKNWQSSISPVVGTIARLLFTKDGFLLALFEYHDYYALPSSVVKLKLGSSERQTIFGERDRAVSDIALLPDGGALIAAVEPPGNSNQVPIPGKLKMLKSGNLKLWEEMDVDYRAIAQRAVLAAPDARHAWVATDTGMILALEIKRAP
jgi:Photosynthesis system II assembly factor YCF48